GTGRHRRQSLLPRRPQPQLTVKRKTPLTGVAQRSDSGLIFDVTGYRPSCGPGFGWNSDVDDADLLNAWWLAPDRPRGKEMSATLVRAMLVTYVTARRAGPTPINRFLTLFPDAGASERELIVSLNADLLVSEMVGADMDAVFDEMEVSIGADLIREIQRGVADAGA
ncbi:MAG TPA: hypothetical protein VFE86_07220, partial [Ilumatobacteraceae bacterium]|nr:hypothetical protein [Ilumatobacteraceae bacterium]